MEEAALPQHPCGKAPPYRKVSLKSTEATPPISSRRRSLEKGLSCGKAKPFRTGRGKAAFTACCSFRLGALASEPIRRGNSKEKTLHGALRRSHAITEIGGCRFDHLLFRGDNYDSG